MIPEEQLHAAVTLLTAPGGDREMSIQIERISDGQELFVTIRGGVTIWINLATGELGGEIGSYHIRMAPSVHNADWMRDLATVMADARTQKMFALSSSIAASNQNRTT